MPYHAISEYVRCKPVEYVSSHIMQRIVIAFAESRGHECSPSGASS
jgi:hypothetical protein